MNVLGIITFTIVEVITLVVWLVLARSGSGIAAVVLAGGLTIEHLIAYNVVNKRPLLMLSGLPVIQKGLVSIAETGVWIVWLALTATSPVFAAMVLGVLLVIEHTLSDNVFRDEGILKRLVNPDTIMFSVVEAGGAAMWLSQVDAGQAVVGIAILAGASLVEHTMAVRLGQRPKVAVRSR